LAAGEDATLRDISLDAERNFALVRREGQNTVTLVSLVDGQTTSATLDAPITDLDVFASGQSAVASLGGVSHAVTLSLPTLQAAPIDLGSAPAGSVSLSPSGGAALFYSNATEDARLARVTLSDGARQIFVLQAPVLAAFFTGDEAHGIVLHHALQGSSKAGAFSLVPLSTELPAKIVGTDAPVTQVVTGLNGRRALVIERDDAKKIYGATLAEFPSLKTTRIALPSAPTSAGVLNSGAYAYIGQAYADGRMTFIDLETGNARTLTGFELAARIVDGRNP